MAIDPERGYDELREHVGHAIEVVTYGPEGRAPANVALECVTCSVVLLDFDAPDEGDD